MPNFTIEFVAQSETEVVREKRVTERKRRARVFADWQNCTYLVHPSGVLEVATPTLKDGKPTDQVEKEYFAQGEWIRVYDGPPKVGNRG